MDFKHSADLNASIGEAIELAVTSRHETIGVDHLFWAMLKQAELKSLLRQYDVSSRDLFGEVDVFLKEYMTSVPDEFEYDLDPVLSHGCHQVLLIATDHSISAGNEEITCINILIAMFRLQDNYSVALLKSNGITRFSLLQYHATYHTKSIDDGLDDDDLDDDDLDDDDLDDGDLDDDDSIGEAEGGGRFKLSDYVTNLNERAKEGKIDPMIGRSEELDRLIHILCRRRKNNPILVGEAGVGKTAIAEGLALAIVEERVPEPLKNQVIYSLEVSSLVAGTRYRGDFEERIKKILKQLKKSPQNIVFIDEIHTFIGAGAVNGGALDASSIFKPMLARGELRCIGATTWKEYRTVFLKDQAFARRFQRVEVNEPNHDEAVEILSGLKSAYEDFHDVKYSRDALEEAVHLSARYFHDRFLPDKAIDVIDEAGAEARLKSLKEVSKSLIESTLARMASIPAQEINQDDREQLKNLDSELKMAVFGQEEAVQQLTTAIKLSRAGLGDPEQPIGSFIFTGPTGVGKTEVSKQLAKSLSLELIRFDMSEYMERHTVSRLIGAPPGYVGFDQGGLLTDAVTKHPHSVVLLDEIEKAHPEVFNILLQVMDHGTLTDNNGRKSDFRNVILIMTSNVGAVDAQKNRPGFIASSAHRFGDDDEAFKRTFSPEFRNRLHARVRFAALSPEVCGKVAEKMCREVMTQLLVKDVHLRFSENAVKALTILGYDPLNGARPMRRVLRDQVSRILADELLFGQLSEGGDVLITAHKDWVIHLEDLQNYDAEESSVSRKPAPPKADAFIVYYQEEARTHSIWSSALSLSSEIDESSLIVDEAPLDHNEETSTVDEIEDSSVLEQAQDAMSLLSPPDSSKSEGEDKS
jgi:ATP-dependent Clp protease ATP-binding subunit ClpA